MSKKRTGVKTFLASYILVAAVLLSAPTYARDASLTWTNASQNTDNSSIPASGAGSLTSTTIEYGTCAAGAFGTKINEIIVAAPAQAATVNMVVVQEYCFRAFHTNTFGNRSAVSNLVVLDNPAPIPRPPNGLAATSPLAYTVEKIPNGFRFLVVGTIPVGTPCRAPYIDTYGVVPTSAVQWSGDIRPVVVVTPCG